MERLVNFYLISKKLFINNILYLFRINLKNGNKKLMTIYNM